MQRGRILNTTVGVAFLGVAVIGCREEKPLVKESITVARSENDVVQIHIQGDPKPGYVVGLPARYLTDAMRSSAYIRTSETQFSTKSGDVVKFRYIVNASPKEIAAFGPNVAPMTSLNGNQIQPPTMDGNRLVILQSEQKSELGPSDIVMRRRIGPDIVECRLHANRSKSAAEWELAAYCGSVRPVRNRMRSTTSQSRPKLRPKSALTAPARAGTQ
jgi:hypothetical protein